MDWMFAAPFSRSSEPGWLDEFLPDSTQHVLHGVPADYTHDSARSVSGGVQWRDYWRHGSETFRRAHAFPQRCGVIVCFPQLSLIAAIRKRLARARDVPLVAWNFNVGRLPGVVGTAFARSMLPAVDRFIVHSRHEANQYAQWLGLPPERFEFVPVQSPDRLIDREEDRAHPFLLAMGAARRDYATLVQVLQRLGLPAVIVAPPHAVAGLDLPANVELRSGLSAIECHRLLQQARVHVIPIDNLDTASGQVTLVDSMAFGRPTVVTRCPATVDYAVDGEDALFVPHRDADAMARAIQTLWEDETAREALGRHARAHALSTLSDSAVARRLQEVLDSLTDA